MVASMRGLGLPMPETGEQLLTPARVRFFSKIFAYWYLFHRVFTMSPGGVHPALSFSVCKVPIRLWFE